MSTQKVPKDRMSHSRHLWVGAFQNKATAKDIAHYFEGFGPLENITVKDNYAFVNYRKISSAVKALEALNGTEMLGSKVAVKYTEGVPTRTLWIGSLPLGVTEQELKEHFQRFGISFINARIFRKTNSATIYYGKIEDAKLAYKQSKNLELRGQYVKIDYGVEPDRSKPKNRRDAREEGDSDGEYNYRAEEGLDPNLRFTITINNNDPPAYDHPPDADMHNIDPQQNQVDPDILQQVVQSLLGTSGQQMSVDPSQVAGSIPDYPSLDPTFLAQLQDTISQAGLFNTANNLNALVSNTSMPDVSRFFPPEDNSNNNARGRFYPSEEANDRHDYEHRLGREEDYYYDRERLIDRNLSRFYNNDRNHHGSREGHRSDPRGSSPTRESYRSENRSRSPSRRSRTPPRESHQLSEEDLLVQARRAVEAGRNRTEESRGQKRSSPDTVSDRPEKRQKTGTESTTPTKSPTLSDKNKTQTSANEAAKGDSLRRSAGKSSGTNATTTVTANGSVDSSKTSSSNTSATASNKTNKTNETPKAGASSTQTNAAKTTGTQTAATKTTASQPKSSAPSPAKTSAPTNNSTTTTSGTIVSASETSRRMEVDSGSGAAPSVASSTNGSAVAPPSTVVSTSTAGGSGGAKNGSATTVVSPTGGSGGAKNGSTTVGTSGANVVSGSAANTTGASNSPSVQGGGSVTSSNGNATSGQSSTVSANKTTAPATSGGTPKAPTAGKSTAAPTTVNPVVFVPVKPEPVRNSTNTPVQQQQSATNASAAPSASQTTSASTLPGTTPTSTSTPAVVQAPSTSQTTQVEANVPSLQVVVQPTAASLLGVSLTDKPSSTASVSAPLGTSEVVSNTNQSTAPPTSNPLAPPGLPPPVSSVSKSVALGFIKNMLDDNPIIPQPPSSPISPPRSPKRIDKPQVWHGYLAKRGTIVCDMVAYFLGGSDLWRKLSAMLDLRERTNLTNLSNFFPTDNTIKPSLLYLQPASKGETFKYASIHRYLQNIGKAGICLGEDEVYRIYVLPMTSEEAIEFGIDDDMALFALIVPRPKVLRS